MVNANVLAYVVKRRIFRFTGLHTLDGLLATACATSSNAVARPRRVRD